MPPTAFSCTSFNPSKVPPTTLSIKLSSPSRQPIILHLQSTDQIRTLRSNPSNHSIYITSLSNTSIVSPNTIHVSQPYLYTLATQSIHLHRRTLLSDARPRAGTSDTSTLDSHPVTRSGAYVAVNRDHTSFFPSTTLRTLTMNRTASLSVHETESIACVHVYPRRRRVKVCRALFPPSAREISALRTLEPKSVA